jgi:hypothetical protein
MKRAIVIGCGVAGLGIIRSLRLKGFEIVAMPYYGMDFSHVSRYVNERIRTSHPLRQEKGLIEVLLKNSHKWKGALILETNDEAAVSISKNKTELANSILRHNRENLGLKDYIRPYLSRNKTFTDLSQDDFIPFLKRISLWPVKHYMFSKSRIVYD